MQQNSKFRQKIILRIFVPFMLAYLLSELFRNVNGIVGPIMFYAVLSNAIPEEYAGRAISLLNLFATLGGFVIQYAVGVIIEWLPQDSMNIHFTGGHQIALFLVLASEILACVWMFWRLYILRTSP